MLAVMAGLYIASALGAPLLHGWVVSGGEIVILVMLLLMFQVQIWGEEQRSATGVDQLRSLAEENARLKAEAARAAREAERVREGLEVEVRCARLAYEELRREQVARPPSPAG
jgi:hypothetical protein